MGAATPSGAMPKRPVAVGILLVVLGLVAIGSPLISGVTIAILVGALVVGGGVAQMVFAFEANRWGQGLLALILGALTVLCGLLLISEPLLGLVSLTLLLAVYFVVEGVGAVVLGLRLRPQSGWVAVVIGGVIGVVLGMMIWSQWPLSGVWAVGTLVGIRFVFSGFALIAVGSAAPASGTPPPAQQT